MEEPRGSERFRGMDALEEQHTSSGHEKGTRNVQSMH
jgi:hypothetical protein